MGGPGGLALKGTALACKGTTLSVRVLLAWLEALQVSLRAEGSGTVVILKNQWICEL